MRRIYSLMLSVGLLLAFMDAAEADFIHTPFGSFGQGDTSNSQTFTTGGHAHSRDVEVITLVRDNLNTHDIGSFYEVFPPRGGDGLGGEGEVRVDTEAWQLAQRSRTGTDHSDSGMLGRLTTGPFLGINN